MNFIQETGRKRNTADNRRKVSAFAAHAGWAENRIRKNGPVPGSRIWVSEAGNNSRGRHRRASAVVAGYHAAGRMEGAPSDPRYRIDRVVSTLLHDIPPEVCSDALDYYCTHIAPIICKAHGLPHNEAESVSPACHPVLSVVLPAIAQDELLLSSVLALSLIYRDRTITRDASTPESIAVLQLRHKILTCVRQRLASKRYDDSTVITIAHLIMIEAAMEKCNACVEVHEIGLQELIKEHGRKKPMISGFTDYLLLASQKASLIVSMRFTALATEGLTAQPTSRLIPAREEQLLQASYLPSGFLYLVEKNFFSANAIDMIVDFHSWLQTHVGNNATAHTVTWTRPPFCNPEGQYTNSTTGIQPLNMWRPRFIPSSPLSNFEKLVILALINLSEIVVGVYDWSLWKMSYDTWDALLHSSSNADDLRIQHCITWCITIMLSSTGQDLVSDMERQKLVWLAQCRFQTQDWCRAELEASLKQYYWIPQDIASWLSLWKIS